MSEFKLPSTLYHVSPVKGITKLKPMSDKYSDDRPQYVPKISLGTTIHGCVQALCLPGIRRKFTWDPGDDMIHVNKGQITKYSYLFYVYAVDTSEMDKRCIVETVETTLEKTAIFDIDITQEVAYSSPIACKCIGTIRVDKLKKPEGLAQFNLPVMVRCTIPLESYWQLDLLDFKVSASSDDEVLLKEKLKEDYVAFLNVVDNALNKYVKITKDNAKKAIVEYTKAGLWVKQNLK